MARNIIVIPLVFVLLFFGCCGPIEPPEGQITGEPGVPDTGDEVPDTGNGAPETGNGGLDLTGLGYSGLIALGVPVECDMTLTEEGFSYKKMYIKGEEIRMDIESQQAEPCRDMIVIMKNDRVYFGCKGEKIMPELGCDWFEFSTEDESADGAGYGFDTSDLEELPPSSFNCKPWIYDSSMMTPSGKSCSMEDIMGAYQIY